MYLYKKPTMKNKIITLYCMDCRTHHPGGRYRRPLPFSSPSSFTWMNTSAITPMLGIVMFGMGLTLRPADFRPVLQHPKDILVGELAQFLIMPSLAWLLCKLLSLPEELALGVILVGCCPGGTASNVICYLAKGDVALSVAMTGVSTLLAPIVTPALVWLLAGASVEDRCCQHVFKYRTSGDSAHRFGSGCQSLFRTDYPADCSAAAHDFYAFHCVHHRHHRSAQSASILACSLIVAVAVILHNVAGSGFRLRTDCTHRKRAAQTVGHCHRGGHAELRTGDFACHDSFCPVPHGGCTRCHVLGMA